MAHQKKNHRALVLNRTEMFEAMERKETKVVDLVEGTRFFFLEKKEYWRSIQQQSKNRVERREPRDVRHVSCVFFFFLFLFSFYLFFVTLELLKKDIISILRIDSVWLCICKNMFWFFFLIRKCLIVSQIGRIFLFLREQN